MQTLKIIIKFVYKLITFGTYEKNLNLKYLMISSFAVALEFHPQLIKNHQILFLKLLEHKFFYHF